MNGTVAITADDTRRAVEFLRSYRGRSEFLLSLQGKMGIYGLSPRQVECVLDNMARAQAVQAQPVAAPVVDEGTRRVPQGTYTVVIADTHRTFKVRDLDVEHCKKYNLPEGSGVLKLLVGSNNDSDYQCVGWLVNGCVRWFRAYRDESIVRDAARVLIGGDWKAAGLAYALASGNCYRCGKTLTVDASICRGLGLTCAGLE